MAADSFWMIFFKLNFYLLFIQSRDVDIPENITKNLSPPWGSVYFNTEGEHGVRVHTVSELTAMCQPNTQEKDKLLKPYLVFTNSLWTSSCLSVSLGLIILICVNMSCLSTGLLDVLLPSDRNLLLILRKTNCSSAAWAMSPPPNNNWG